MSWDFPSLPLANISLWSEIFVELWHVLFKHGMKELMSCKDEGDELTLQSGELDKDWLGLDRWSVWGVSSKDGVTGLYIEMSDQWIVWKC